MFMQCGMWGQWRHVYLSIGMREEYQDHLIDPLVNQIDTCKLHRFLGVLLRNTRKRMLNLKSMLQLNLHTCTTVASTKTRRVFVEPFVESLKIATRDYADSTGNMTLQKCVSHVTRCNSCKFMHAMRAS